jgi:lipoprotein-anchoring transpeptidase ErfK/SrfK
VPFSNSLRANKDMDQWEALYRLYYQSVHWVTGIDEGPDGEPWYRLSDELLKLDYHVPASHVRLIPDEELTPLSTEVDPGKKFVQVNLIEQTLTAYENNEVVLHTKVSTGLPTLGRVIGLPTETPRGNFNIDPKVPAKHMGNGQLTADITAYELPGVPWTCFFEHMTGIAFHGTYWHNNFGWQMSHGCVNMRNEDAKWIFRWTMPANHPPEVEKNGFGTQVRIT